MAKEVENNDEQVLGAARALRRVAKKGDEEAMKAQRDRLVFLAETGRKSYPKPKG